jgi:uncharacterized protein (TIGR02599 family)
MNPLAQKSSQGRYRGFTLVEMLVAVSILALIMVLAAQMIGATSKIWKNTTSKIEAFQNARDGFQLLTDELRQATTNTYWDYFDGSGYASTSPSASTPFKPAAYGRQSDLHFKSGRSLVGVQLTSTHSVFFQAPLGYVASPGVYGGLQNLLNGVGFFIQVSNGSNVVNVPPPFLGTSNLYRYRLMQFIQPSEQNGVYNYSLSSTPPSDWFVTPIAATATYATDVRIVANNIIALVIWPKATDTGNDTLTTNYAYDSRLGLNSGAAVPSTTWVPGSTGTIGLQPLQMNQCPPIIRIAMVAIDEPSAKTLTVNASGLSGSLTAAYSQSNLTDTPTATEFANPQNFDNDLLYYQYGPKGLASIKPRLNFRVFTSTIVVKASRFSTQ